MSSGGNISTRSVPVFGRVVREAQNLATSRDFHVSSYPCSFPPAGKFNVKLKLSLRKESGTFSRRREISTRLVNGSDRLYVETIQHAKETLGNTKKKSRCRSVSTLPTVWPLFRPVGSAPQSRTFAGDMPQRLVGKTGRPRHRSRPPSCSESNPRAVFSVDGPTRTAARPTGRRQAQSRSHARGMVIAAGSSWGHSSIAGVSM